jgi:hypothetical protein
MQPSQFKKLARLLKDLYAQLEAEAMQEGVSITSPDFDAVVKKARTLLLEREGFTDEQYEEAKSANLTEREAKKTASETKADQFFERVEKIKGDKGEKGDRGDVGETGPRGEQGPEGKQGKPGKDGQNGKDGKPGPKGDKGDKGEQGEMGTVDNATIAYLEDRINTTESKIPTTEKLEEDLIPRVIEVAEVTAKKNLDIFDMPGLRKMGMGLRQDLDTKIEGVNVKKLTVSDTEPTNPQPNDLWIDIDGTSTDGDVVGPASSTDNAIARFDSTTGKIIQNSTVTVGDAGGIATTIAGTGNAVGLTVTQNDITNNPNGITINNTGTGNALFINQDGNGRSLVIDSEATTVDTIRIDGLATGTATNRELAVIMGGALTGNSSTAVGALFYNNNASTTGTIFGVTQDNASASGDVMRITQDGTGKGLLVDQNGNGITVDLDKDITNTNQTTESFRVIHTSVVNDAGTYTKSGSAVSITSNVTETSGTITDSAQVLDINQTHADATGNVVDVANSGGGRGLSMTMSQAAYASEGIFVDIGNSTASGSGLFVRHSGSSGEAIFVDVNSNARGIDIDHDGNSASAITGLFVNVANAGAGAAYGLVVEAGLNGLLTTAPTHTLTLGSTGTGIALYNTADQTTNYERLRAQWSSNTFVISSEVGGTGTNRELRLSQSSLGGTSLLSLHRSGTAMFNVSHAGSTTSVINSFTTSGSGFNSNSGSQAFLSLTPTFNQSGTAGYTGLLINPTESSTGSGAKNLILAQVGGVDKFVVDNAGTITGKGAIILDGTTTSSGAGAVGITGSIHEITTTGTGDALTLANGTEGQRLTIVYVAEGAGTDTAVLTPTSFGSGSTITFAAVGQSARLIFTNGKWYADGDPFGAVIA